MHIAYINADNGVPAFGTKGCSIHVQEIIRAWCKRGAHIHLLTATRGGEVPSDWASIRISDIPGVPLNNSLISNPRLFQSAVEVLNDSLINLLTCGDYISHFDLVYERYSLWSHSGMDVAQKRGVPALLEVNAPLLEEQNRYRSRVDCGLAVSVAQRAFSSADALIAVSQEVADYLDQFAEARGKICVIANGVDPSRFRFGTLGTRPRCPETFVVGFVGSFKPWHGLDVLLKAFALLRLRVPKARLLLVGDGPERSNVVRQVASKALSSTVDLTGAVPASDIPGLLASMDVAVAPYPQASGFYFSPLKLYEYMAAGLPVVASDVGQIGKLIEQGVTGCLVPPGDCTSLADAIAILKERPVMMRDMGHAARAQVRREHTWDMIVDRISMLL